MQETLIDSQIKIPQFRNAKRDPIAEALSKVQFDHLPYEKILIICAVGLSALMLYLSISNDFHNAHFDSKGHQLVARRIADNLSPGWIQIGAFWLPLPHVLYYPLVKNDWIYFNGFGGIPFSVLSYLVSVVLLYRLLKKRC